MPVVYSAIIPHPPLLIPFFQSKNQQLLKDLLLSINQVKEHLYHKNIDTVIIISPHSTTTNEIISINSAATFNLDFSTFGDLSVYPEQKNDLDMIGLIHDHINNLVILNNQQAVGYDQAIPIALLSQNLPVKYVLINVANATIEQIKNFTTLLSPLLHLQHQRIALIASGDLSHQLNQMNTKVKFLASDNIILEWLKNKSNFDIDQKLITLTEFSDAGICLAAPLITLLGLINEQNYICNILRTDNLAGINYLVAEFII